MSRSIEFTPGLPPPLTGACIFLMWDGNLVEGTLFKRERDGRYWLVHFNFADQLDPERIEQPADGGKVLGYVSIAPSRTRAAEFSASCETR